VSVCACACCVCARVRACVCEHVREYTGTRVCGILISRHTEQCVAVCCSVLQCVAVCCSVLQCDAMCCNTYWRIDTYCTAFSASPTSACILPSRCNEDASSFLSPVSRTATTYLWVFVCARVFVRVVRARARVCMCVCVCVCVSFPRAAYLAHCCHASLSPCPSPSLSLSLWVLCVCARVRVFVCVCVCVRGVFECLFVCMYAFMHLYTCMYIYMYIYIYCTKIDPQLEHK